MTHTELTTMKIAYHTIYLTLIILVAVVAFECGREQGINHINELIKCGWTVIDAEGYEIAGYNVTEK